MSDMLSQFRLLRRFVRSLGIAFLGSCLLFWGAFLLTGQSPPVIASALWFGAVTLTLAAVVALDALRLLQLLVESFADDEAPLDERGITVGVRRIFLHALLVISVACAYTTFEVVRPTRLVAPVAWLSLVLSVVGVAACFIGARHSASFAGVAKSVQFVARQERAERRRE